MKPSSRAGGYAKRTRNSCQPVERLEPRTLLSTTWVVTSAADNGGSGTLRTIAHQALNGDTITFSPTLFNPSTPQTITLTSLLALANVTIQGPGETSLTITGNFAGSLIQTSPGTTTLSGMIITNPDTSNYALLNYGTLDTDGALFYNSRAGAVSNSGVLNATSTQFSGNYAFDGPGVLNNPNATANFTGCYFNSNDAWDLIGGGAGIYNEDGAKVTVDSTAFDSNYGTNGAGIDNHGNGTVVVTNSTFQYNVANNYGGAIYNSTTGTFKIYNSTAAGNQAFQGGAIYNDNALTVVNCTLTANLVQRFGGGLDENSGTALVDNTILSGNQTNNYNSTTLSPDDLIPTGSLAAGSANNYIGGNARLATLSFYGGATETTPALPGSPVIDAGSNALAIGPGGQPLATDQRGIARVINGTVDIGATEADPVVINGTTNNDTLTLTRDSDQQHIDWSIGPSGGKLLVGDPSGLTFNGNGGNDTIALNNLQGSPLPAALELNGTFSITGLQTFTNTTMDIGRSTVRISYAASSDPIAAIRTALQTGYNNGGWNGVSYTSAPVITTSAGDANHGIGYADAADGAGINTVANTVELKYTLYGDANLDGTVGLADFLLTARNFGKTGAWDGGDFNYDGTTNLTDLRVLVRHFGQFVTPTLSAADVLLQTTSASRTTRRRV